MFLIKLSFPVRAAVACTLFSAVATANLVSNGSFESTSQSDYNFVVNDPTTLTSWTLASGAAPNVDDCIVLSANATNPNHMCGTNGQQNNSIYNMYNVPGASPSGGNYFLMDGDPTTQTQTELEQTLTTVVGQEYTLTFYQASGTFIITSPSNGDTTTTEQWEVFFGSQTAYSTLMTTLPQAADPWQQISMNFVATSTSTVLGFLAVGTPTSDPPTSFLDGVDVEASPEPSTIALTGLGLLMVPVALRLRRKRQS